MRLLLYSKYFTATLMAMTLAVALVPASLARPVQQDLRERTLLQGLEALREVTPDAPDEPEPGRWIVVYAADQEPALRSEGVSIWDRDGSFVIGSADQVQVVNLAEGTIEPVLKIADRGELIYVLSHDEGFAGPAAAAARFFTFSPTADLYLFPPNLSFELPRVKPRGGFHGVPRVPLPPVKPHEADLRTAAAAETLTINPLVTQIVNATSQANWFQYVKDLSGENTVVIGGNTFTIRTRYSYAMYPTPALNAYATEYLLDKGAGWGYTGVRETYTPAQSGCSQGGNTWQNVVFTLPGQVDFGQHQQVLFVTHHDSLSFNSTESFNYAPGADDAISGGSALIEALRLFKDYGFKNTVKIIFFSGEEQGLCGSYAYTRQPQHPAGDIWRVINMDQTAYDWDHDRVMNVYNWDAVNSPGSVALGDAFVQTNSDYGPIITPANLFRATPRMCQTDHCPFWSLGVAAIAVLEDLFHNQICPCFDQTQTATCHDTVMQVDPNHPPQLMFDQNYSWLSEKAAIATVAALAEPLYACPASAPTPSITPGNNVLHVTWPAAAGVTNYVLERGSSCAGPFTAITSATGTSYDDVSVTNGTSYAYQVRTCPTQTSACVTGTPQPSPSVTYQPGSATITADSGDHDNIADNCELVTAQVNLFNDGDTPLTGVKLSAVGSTHPGVQVATAIPQTVGNLGVGASAPASFKFYLGRNGSSAACGESLPFTVTATSDQSPQISRSFSFTSERDVTSSTFSYGFETDLSGWTVTTGSFTRVVGGAPGSTAFSLHSRNVHNDCDVITSPVVTPTASSAMTMWVNYGIEGNGSTTNIYDRAVVRAIDTTTGVKTLLVPSGAPYTTTGCGGVTLCDGLCNVQGWAGSATTWRQASFNLSAFAGIPIQIDVRFSTDTNTLGSQGFWFDAVQITNLADCDTQANACPALPAEVSPNASPVQFTIAKNGGNYDLRFSEVAGATTYNIYGGTLDSVHTGGYDHAAGSGICSLTDPINGDGQVTASVAAATFPDNAYFLVAARNAAGESIYGLASSGATIPLALASCP